MDEIIWVERVRDGNDRHIVRIYLLEEGVRIANEVIQKRRAYLGGIVRRFFRSTDGRS